MCDRFLRFEDVFKWMAIDLAQIILKLFTKSCGKNEAIFKFSSVFEFILYYFSCCTYKCLLDFAFVNHLPFSNR